MVFFRYTPSSGGILCRVWISGGLYMEERDLCSCASRRIGERTQNRMRGWKKPAAESNSQTKARRSCALTYAESHRASGIILRKTLSLRRVVHSDCSPRRRAPVLACHLGKALAVAPLQLVARLPRELPRLPGPARVPPLPFFYPLRIALCLLKIIYHVL